MGMLMTGMTGMTRVTGMTGMTGMTRVTGKTKMTRMTGVIGVTTLRTKWMLLFIIYIKACVLNNSARALLAFQVTYFPTRNRIKI